MKDIEIKWPQCVVIGKKVTVEQAREILIKTDYFFTSAYPGGNDEKYDSELRKQLNMPPIYSWDKDVSDRVELFKKNEAWQILHDCLHLNYFINNWISSSYVGGPNGWCHVNGNIHSAINIGKWPSWDEVEEDLQDLGKVFPFLDMCVYVMNCESGCGFNYDEDFKRECIGGLHLCNGIVTEIPEEELIDPYDERCHEDNGNCFSGISENSKKELAEVVDVNKETSFESRCPGEHLFTIEQALDYFKASIT